jgi:hypothetical protein
MILKKKQRQEAATQSQFYNSENQTPEGHDDDTNIVVESNILKIAQGTDATIGNKISGHTDAGDPNLDRSPDVESDILKN